MSSYVVLARKYRPMFFQDVVGQEHVTQTLQNAVEQSRIANAYLFSGPRGVGKTTVARLLAKALNCEQGPTINPCNTCDFCKEINESRSLDVFEIDGASNRGIDEVRNLRESLRYSPNPGKHRIYIIDEVHMLTNEAFNALLKTLEEPPKNVLFIFATTEPHKVPATILSRCQRFDFKRMSAKNIAKQLKEMCDKENVKIDEESLRLLAVKADGSMRDSQSVLDQVIAFSGKDIHAQNVADLLGIIDQELFFQITDLIKHNNVKGGVELTNTIFTEGYDFSEFLTGLAEHLRNILIVKSTQSSEELDVSEDQAARYMKLAKDFEVEDLLRLVKIATDADTLVRKSSNSRLHLEVAIVKMIKLTKSIQLSQLFEQIEDIKKKPSPPVHVVKGPSYNVSPPVPPSRTAEPSNNPTIPFAQQIRNLGNENKDDENLSDKVSGDVNITFEDIEKHWTRVVEAVKKKKIALGSFLGEGWPTSLDGNVLTVSFDKKNGFHISSLERNRQIIEETVLQVCGARITVSFKKAEEGILENVRKMPQVVDKKTEFAKLVEENSTIKKIVETFDAEYVESSNI